jgi:hypothetical protein
MSEDTQPQQQQQELSESQLADMAAQLDATGEAETTTEATPDSDATPAEDAALTNEEAGDANANPAQTEASTQENGPGTEAADQQIDKTKSESEYTRTRKEHERRDRSWQKLEEEKNLLRRDREAVEIERRRTNQTAAPRDESGYSADDYEIAARSFEENGDPELAGRARSRAQTLRHTAQTRAAEGEAQEFRAKWQETINKVVEERPELRDVNSDLGRKVATALRTHPHFSYTPEGFRRAVEHVELQEKAASLPGLHTEVERLKTENQRLNRLTSVGGSGVMHRPGSASFDQMTRAEQEAELTHAAEAADRQAT